MPQTRLERNIMYWDHCARGADYIGDKPLCRWVLARYARRFGRHFFHLENRP